MQNDQWADGASFFNISLVDGGADGSPRRFQILRPNVVNGKVDKIWPVAWEEALAHNSCLAVDSDTNNYYKHAVPPRDLKQEAPGTRWSIVCRHLVSSIRKDPEDVRTFDYKVTNVETLQRWKFTKEFADAFPFAKDSEWVITWKGGRTQHLTELINERECKFRRSQLKNEAHAKRSFELLEDMFTWAEDNGVGFTWSSQKYHREKLQGLIEADEGGASSG